MTIEFESFSHLVISGFVPDTRWQLMVNLPEPTRVLTKLAPNNAAAVMNRLADAVAHDLNRPRVGVRALFTDENTDLKITHLPYGVMMVDACVEGLDEPYMLLGQLIRPVIFPNGDRRGVDLVAVLLSPDTSMKAHLQMAARLARILRDTDLISSWRTETSTDSVSALFRIPIAHTPIRQSAAA